MAAVALAGVVGVWGLVSLCDDAPEVGEIPVNGYAAVENVPPASHFSRKETVKPAQKAPEMDAAMMQMALMAGAEPTQKVGEHGSLNGELHTKTPMVYAETKYERLPDSPLIRFTDDMIWQDGSANDFRVLKDAVYDQAQNIMEASVALSVSPRVEYGKIQGYRLVEIPNDTLFSKLGLVSGDIVMSINGTMPDMEPMALMFVNMVAGQQGASTIEVEHRGVRRTIHLRAAE